MQYRGKVFKETQVLQTMFHCRRLWIGGRAKLGDHLGLRVKPRRIIGLSFWSINVKGFWEVVEAFTYVGSQTELNSSRKQDCEIAIGTNVRRKFPEEMSYTHHYC